MTEADEATKPPADAEGRPSTQPEASVVVCSIGGAPLDRAVRSIAASATRSGTEAEIIVIWQGAGDPPALEPRVREVRSERTAHSVARNLGLGAARAPIVAFVDDDEVVAPDWLTGVVTTFRRHPEAAGVFGSVLPLDDRGLAHCEFRGDRVRAFSGAGVRPWRVGTGGNMAFRRRPLLAVGGFDPVLGVGSAGRSADETDVILRLLKQGETLLWTPDIAVLHPTKTVEELLGTRYPYAYGMGVALRRNGAWRLALRYAVNVARTLVRAPRAGTDARASSLATARGFVSGLLATR